jgi:tyrosine-protein phosphatase SIW14
MVRVIQVAVGSVIVLTLIVAPIVFAVRQQARTRNFRVVRPGVLYRSGQMSKDGLQRTINDYHINTVISLRDGQTAADKAEEQLCKSLEINFVRILPSRWGDEGGSVPIEAGVRRFREILADPRNHPVLVHCFAGIHRAGSYSAIYRMEFERWSNARAIAEMKSCGYSNLDEELDILSYLEQYRPSWMPKIEEPSATSSANEKETPTVKKAHCRKPTSKTRPKPHRNVS